MMPTAARASRSRLSSQARVVIDTLLPSNVHSALPLGAIEAGFEDFLAEFELQSAPRLRFAFRAGLFAGAWVAPLLIGRPPPLGRLSPTDRVRALSAMERSRVVTLRQLTRVLKTVIALHYGSLPAVRTAIGYHA